MNGFFGEYQHTIDAKGRLIVPARYREGLGDSFILTEGPDQCLYAYPLSEWEKITAKMQENMSFSRNDSRAFVRKFFASASECETDNLGRVLVANHLREYADLKGKKEVTIIGVSSRVEIWSREKWEQYCSDNAEMMDIGSGMEIFDI